MPVRRQVATWICGVLLATTGADGRAAGGPDAAFGVDGVARLSAAAAGGPVAFTDLVALPDGGVVAVGAAPADSRGDSYPGPWLVAAFTPDGRLDPGFGTGGVAEPSSATKLGRPARILRSVRDGALWIGGTVRQGFYDILTVQRLKSAGDVDREFGDASALFFLSRQFSYLTALRELPGRDGVFAIGWTSEDSYDSRPILLGVTARGAVDATLPPASLPDAPPGLVADAWLFNDMAVDSNGGVVLAGYGYENIAFGSFCLLARYGRDGRLDPAFGDGGFVRVKDGAVPFAGCTGVVVQGDGRILVAGSGTAQGRSVSLLARFLGDGRPDRSFGAGGFRSLADEAPGTLPRSIALAGDGAIWIAGERLTEGPFAASTFVARLLPSGVPDPAFGNRGVFYPDPALRFSWPGPAVARMALDARGRPLLAGGDGAGWVLRIDPLGSGRGYAAAFPPTATREEFAAATLTVRRGGSATGTVSVSYRTIGGSAIEGVDYEAAAGTLTWAPGDFADRTVRLVLKDDAAMEGEEEFALELFAPVGDLALTDARVQVRIAASDAPPAGATTASSAPGSTVASASSGGGGALGRGLLSALVVLGLLRHALRAAMGRRSAGQRTTAAR